MTGGEKKAKKGIKDITGQRYGYLTAVSLSSEKRRSNRLWNFRCDCGKMVVKDPTKLTKHSASCGCMHSEMMKRKNLIEGVNDLATLRPDLASEWDCEKNTISPSVRTEASTEKVWWKCKEGHSYVATIAERAKSGNGCPFCSGRRVITGKTDLKTLNPEVVKEWDFDKNTKNPDEVTQFSSYNAYWICPKGHGYRKPVRERVSQNIGCPYCVGTRALAGFNDLGSMYPEIADEWDYEKNNGLTPKDVIFGSSKKVWWKCSLGHEYLQAIDNRTRQGQGCPYCSNKKVLKGYNDLMSRKPEIASEWNCEKNTVGPDEYVYGSGQTVWWKCKDCGCEWKARIVARTGSADQGCPKCIFPYHTSGPEQAVFFYVSQFFEDAVNSYRAKFLGKMEIDIYIPSLKLAIEYDGELAHNNLEKDLRKTRLLTEKGIALIRLRDERLQPIEDGSFQLTVNKRVDYDISVMKDVIIGIFSFIEKEYGITANPDVDMTRDYSRILSMYESKKQEKSLAASGRDIIKEWNYEKNFPLTPEKVTSKSNKPVWWKCSFCGYEWQAKPNYRRKLGCESCSRRNAHFREIQKQAAQGQTKHVVDVPELIVDWDYEKNIGLDPKVLTFGSQEYAYWKCHKCGKESRRLIYGQYKLKKKCDCCLKE